MFSTQHPVIFSRVKAVVVKKPGDPSVLEYMEVPTPNPQPDKVLIRIRAFGLNRAELFTRQGHSPGVEFPRILGIECVGEVEHDSSGQFEQGQSVTAIMGGMGRQFDGSYAEYCSVPHACVSTLPETTLSWEILAALPEMFQTTSGSLNQGLGLKSGDTLLIRGGTSSIGLTALALGKQKGLKVFTTTRNESRVASLKSKGADQVVLDNGKIADQIGATVDGVLELVGTQTLLDSLRCTKPQGIVCMTGILGGQWQLSSFEPMGDIPHTVRLTAYSGGSGDLDETEFHEFIRAIERQEVEVPLDRQFSLNQLPEAHTYMEANRAMGKIIVEPD